jgi:glycosyltransferase involved in cell wall biosynthesis
MASLVIVTRRYWPLVEGQEVLMASLASSLTRRGHQVTILTAQWSANWPLTFVDGQVTVVRLPQRRSSMWGTWRFMTRIDRWIRKHAGDIDGIIVSRIGYSAYAVLGATNRRGRGIPTIVSAVAESGHDLRWLRQNPLAPRIRLRIESADSIVVNSEYGQQMLLSAGFEPTKICMVPLGVPTCALVSNASRHAARRDLRATNPDLALPVHGRLAVTIGSLYPGNGLDTLIRAWQKIVGRHQDARLWIIGDGQDRDHLLQLKKDLDLAWHVLMPGTFEEIDEVLAAADVYVVAGDGSHGCRPLEAMAIGLPVIAVDGAWHRELFGLNGTGSILCANNVSDLEAAFDRVFADPRQRNELGVLGRNRVQHRNTIDGMVRAYERLLLSR